MNIIERDKNNIERLKGMNLRAVMFDMDGVLFDSMPYHASAWISAMSEVGIVMSEYDAYMREGMTGSATIHELFMQQKGRIATDDEIRTIYDRKCEYFRAAGKTVVIPNITDVLDCVKNNGLDIYVVTGSGQKDLTERLDHFIPGYFSTTKMVTAFDVKKGKPDPEPYLMAMEKGNFKPNEILVIENAPLGVKAGHASGAFTIGVNTGILKQEDLYGAGADLVCRDMSELRMILPFIIEITVR